MKFSAQKVFRQNSLVGVLSILVLAPSNTAAQSFKGAAIQTTAAYRCVIDDDDNVIEEDGSRTRVVSAAYARSALEGQIQTVRTGVKKARAKENLAELNACLSAAGDRSGSVSQPLGGAGGSCDPMPLIRSVLPGNEIQSNGDRVQLGLLGHGYAPGSRMVLALSVNGGQLQEHPYTLTHLASSAESSGIVRTTIAGEVATYSLRLFTRDSSGRFYCRSNEVEVQVQEGGACSPCGFPFASTAGCKEGDFIIAHDGYLDPDDGAAFLANLALLLATDNMHRLKHLHFGNPPHTFNAFLHERMRQKGQLAVNYGYNGEVFDAHFDRARTVENMVAVMSRATACNRIYVMAAGPFQILHDALTQLTNLFGRENLPFISIVNHSIWNGQAGGPEGYKTQAHIEADFGEVRIEMVPDGNHVFANQAGNTFGFESFPLLAPIRIAMQETLQWPWGLPYFGNDMSDLQELWVTITGQTNSTIPEYYQVMQPLMIP